MDTLPEELISHIFSFSRPNRALYNTSKGFRRVIEKNSLLPGTNNKIRDEFRKGNWYFISQISDQMSLDYALYGSSEGGYMEIVIMLVSRGATDFNNALFYACKGGHMNIVLFLLSYEDTDINYGLRGACKGGHLALALFLLERGDLELTKKLIKDRECDPRIYTSKFLKCRADELDKAFIEACEGGNIEICMELYNRNVCDIHDYGLQNACYFGHNDLVFIIMSRRYSYEDFSSSLSFQAACYGGHVNIFRTLMLFSDYYFKDICLRIACERGHIDLVRFLLGLGCTELDEALLCACEGDHMDIVELLLDFGYENYNMGLQCACYSGKKEMVVLFLGLGANNLGDVLCYACESGNIDIVILLLDRMKIEDEKAGINSALYYACREGYDDIVLLLLIRGADDLDHALLGACAAGHSDIVLLLLLRKQYLLHGDSTMLK